MLGGCSIGNGWISNSVDALAMAIIWPSATQANRVTEPARSSSSRDRPTNGESPALRTDFRIPDKSMPNRFTASLSSASD
jgi:hypothetical protein